VALPLASPCPRPASHTATASSRFPGKVAIDFAVLCVASVSGTHLTSYRFKGQQQQEAPHMFKSFFPNPRLFFLSAPVWALVTILFWYFAAKDWGQYIGLENPPAGTPPIIGPSVFVSKPFLWFYIYYAAIVAIFAGAWWKQSPHPWFAWSVLGTALIVFYTYFNVQLSVAINAWYGPFYDLLNEALTKSRKVEISELYYSLLTFAGLATVFVLVVSTMRFFIRHFIFRWRRAMHEYYMSHWQKLRGVEGASQRVQDDAMQFARAMEVQGVSFVSAVMTLIAFLPILYGYSKHITELPLVGAIPQALVWASIFWSVLGTVFVYLIGIRLPGLEFKNQRVEAALRKELVYGEDAEHRADDFTVNGLFEDLKKNYYNLYKNYVYFDLGRNVYLNADTVYSLILLFPSIVAGTMTLGLFQQISHSFDQVRGSIQVLFNDWDYIIKLISIYRRLRTFEGAIEGSGEAEIKADEAYGAQQA
jgi:peptide/bleomycin uptake transporter